MVGLLACVILSGLRAEKEQLPFHIEQCIISGAAGCIHTQYIIEQYFTFTKTCRAKYLT